MRLEMEAVMALVPLGEASARASRDGAWSDPETWGGELPSAGATVHIPEGVRVSYDGTRESAPVRWLRVDGALAFDTARDTHLTIDTLVVGHGGTLEVGTREAPVTASAEVVFAGDEPVQTGPDRLQFERGLVNLGTTRLAGLTKTAFVELAVQPRAGDTTLALRQAPEGWHEGDRVVLTGARHRGRGEREEEVRTVEAIDGAEIRLDEPLAHDHVLPEAAGVHPYLGNLTRNVRFASADTEILRRGHVMFMHSDAVDVHAVEFDQLGRSNKEIFADDPDPGPDGTRLVGETHASPMTGSNVRGRYAVHLHRMGVKPGSTCVSITDSVVEGSPGWGFVNHGSHGCIRDNVAHDVLGAAFVAEAGTEIGDFTRNLAVGSRGSDPERADFGPHTDTQLLDMWHEGIGFGLRSNAVAIEGNVATDQASEGFSWDLWDPEPYTIPAGALPERGFARSRPSIGFREQPLLAFSSNVAIATLIGAHLDGMGSTAERGVYDVVSGFTAVNSAWLGIHLRYSTAVIRDVKLVNDAALRDGPGRTVGINLGPSSQDDTRVDGEYMLNGVTVRGFELAIDNAEPMDTEGSPHPTDVQAFAVDLDDNDRGFAVDERLVVHERAPAAYKPVLHMPERLEIVNGGSGLRFEARVEDGAGMQKVERFDYSHETVNARIDAGYHGSAEDPYVLLELPLTDRLSGEAETVEIRAYFSLTQFPDARPLDADARD